MTKLIGSLAVSAAMVLAPLLAIAQDGTEWQTEPAPQATPQPDQLPPAPPAEQPYAPEQPYAAQEQPYATQEQPYSWQEQQPYASQQQPQTQAQVPPGQWVYTQQYGWIWMPYADAYTQVPANGYGEPYAYVYASTYNCWAWLAAPWVWGIGPWPVFGVYGPAHFAWYGHGWWRHPARWHYAPGPAYAGYGSRPGYRGAWSPARPAPYRSGSSVAHPAPYRSVTRSAPNRGAYGSYRGSVSPAPRGGAAYVGRGGHTQGFARPQAAVSGRAFNGGGGSGGRSVAGLSGGGRGGQSGGGRGGQGHGRR